ncbi:hypothetical protein EDB84DRAFT_1572768 [Lactarius hengduanensis]|nr:hypothetical protein EDB84DRAFT_1572768 [Lactarius hengduanensis]
MAVAYPTPHIFYSAGRGVSNTDDWFISFHPHIYKIISISYVINEKSSSLEYSIYVCDMFGRLGLLGIIALCTTGDDGVGKDCTLNDGTVRFKPNFPQPVPIMSPPLAEPRTTIRSSGRILGNKYKGLYKRIRFRDRSIVTYSYFVLGVSGRGIPDISAQAFGFQIFVGGKEKEVYGTSGSTHLCVSWVVRPRAPDVLQVVAGIILNGFQISDNRYTLCFLNPWLYRPPA